MNERDFNEYRNYYTMLSVLFVAYTMLAEIAYELAI